MPTQVVFKSYDLGYELDFEVPDGLPDKKALKQFVDNLKYSYDFEDKDGNLVEGSKTFSRRDRASAFRAARRVYKAYNREWWEEVGEGYDRDE